MSGGTIVFPSHSVLDKAFVYRKRDHSDIRETFRLHQEQQAEEAKRVKREADSASRRARRQRQKAAEASNVLPLFAEGGR